MKSLALKATTAARELSGVPQEIQREYAASRPVSLEVFNHARQFLPGGETRSVTYYGPFPSVIDSAAGSQIVDVDGNQYLDVLNNYTSLVHGNGFGPIAQRVGPLLSAGVAFASIHREQVGLAERICSRLSSAELVRFTNSGSEASALAVRIARHATGRRQIVIAEGGYHGSVPPFVTGEPDIVRVSYNDVQALQSAVTEKTAAVFLEPFLGAGGVIPGTADFLRAAQEAASAKGTLFVLDEVQSLRTAPGGAQGEIGLTPDLTVLGKVIGGGFPIGAVCGRAALMDSTSPFTPGRLEHAGTFNGHLAAVAAGSVSLDYLDGTAIEKLNTQAADLATSITAVARRSGVAVAVSRAGSILNVHPLTAPAQAVESGHFPAFRKTLHLCLLLEGVYSATRGMINLSTALSPDDLDEITKRYQRAFERIAQYPVLLDRTQK
ncbi:aminotransferase class III-fold pyridoxal phosphate-dependent enzyme [Paenarthrobacter sp. NPDC089322]|uniref:aspartate aminotransferase family protein n=1 Tax=Paenarthrobacter sp. NPDC089322 TaxID=3155065 RepID=UPI0034331FD6